MEYEPETKPPLSGLRVIDLSRLVAGNMLSLQLADYGRRGHQDRRPAERGDPLRPGGWTALSLYWKVYAREQEEPRAQPATRWEGRALCSPLLAETSQVLVENFRPGTLEDDGNRAGEVLTSQPPPGHRDGCPGSARTGRIATGPASAPWSRRCRVSPPATATRSAPVLPPLALADMVAGLYGAYAVMVALREAERSGRGQVIDLPLLDPLVSILGPEAEIFRRTGEVPARTGSRSATTTPRNVFATADGRWIAISASIQAMTERLLRAIGRPDMIDDPRFRTNADRVRNADACEAPIAAFIAARTLGENMALFEAAEVTAAPVYDIEQFLADPHVQARRIVADLPDAELGSVMMHNVVPQLSTTPGKIRHPAPRLGQHTRELLSAIGCDGDRLAALAADGVVKEE